MTDLLLIRHAEKLAEPGDAGLSRQGIRQARAIARDLRPDSIAALVTSPLRRAVETAEILGEELDLPVHRDGRLVERLVTWTPDDTEETYRFRWEMSESHRDWHAPGDESSKAAGDRLRLGAIDWLERFPGETVAFVTHGGVIHDFVRNVAGDAVASAPASTRVVIPLASLSRITFASRAFIVDSIGGAGPARRNAGEEPRGKP